MIICDIETRPLPTAANSFDENEYRDNVKVGNRKEHTAEAYRNEMTAKAKDAYIEKAALWPITGAVCAIGYIDTEDPDTSHRIDFAWDEEGEKRILSNFWDEVARERVVGYNFLEFDLPFLLTRSRILRVNNRLGSYNLAASKVTDVYNEVVCVPWAKNNLFPNAKLEAIAAEFGVRNICRDHQCESKNFWSHISSGNDKKISMAENHLKADLHETLGLAEVCGLISFSAIPQPV